MSQNEREVFQMLKQKYPDLMRYKFKQVMNMIIEEMADPEEGFEPIHMGFVPDGYLWDIEKKECIIFEIENQNYISPAKWTNLGFTFSDFEYYDWDLRLIIVNRFGDEAERHLGLEYVKALKRQLETKENV